MSGRPFEPDIHAVIAGVYRVDVIDLHAYVPVTREAVDIGPVALPDGRPIPDTAPADPAAGWAARLDAIYASDVSFQDELLGQLLDSAFEGPPSPLSSQQMNQRFASPLQQFAGQLQALGVNAGTVGEVLNSLNKLLKQKGERGLKRFKGAKGAQQSLSKAADLMSSLLRAAEDARQ